MALTIRQTERAKKPGRYGDGHNLYLQVTKTGCKSWILRYERGGKERLMGLGTFANYNLEEARERARLARRQLADGIDPLAERQAQKATKTMTFAEAAREYFALHQSQWKNATHKKQFMSSLEAHALPIIGKLPVAAIDTGAVLSVLEPIWLTKTTTATRVRARIEAILSWASVRGLRSETNPARWSGHLKAALPAKGKVAKVVHHAAMPYHEVPALLASLANREEVAARALEFLILTAARSGEVIGARWSEINFDTRVWTIPAERMKAGKEHRVPLSDRAVALLRSLPREADYLFIGSRIGMPIGPQGMSHILKRLVGTEVTVHGFRSSFRDWCAEKASCPHEVAEAALAHISAKSAVVAAYQRSDFLERRVRVMADWATYCSRPVSVSKVIPLHG